MNVTYHHSNISTMLPHRNIIRIHASNNLSIVLFSLILCLAISYYTQPKKIIFIGALILGWDHVFGIGDIWYFTYHHVIIMRCLYIFWGIYNVSSSLVRSQITLTFVNSRVEGKALHRIDMGLIGWYHNMRGCIQHKNHASCCASINCKRSYWFIDSLHSCIIDICYHWA